MPDRKSHLEQARRNEEAAELFEKNGYADWAATGLFYAALHLIDAYLAEPSSSVPLPSHPPDHEARNGFVRKLASKWYAVRMVRIQELVAQNPWWRDPAAIDRDPKLLQLASSPFQRTPITLDTFQFDLPNVYTLRGPRQVGKSTAVKLLIRRLLRDGFPARRVLYASVELERTPRDIRDIVVRAKEQFKTGGS